MSGAYDIDGPVGRALWERADRALPGGAVYLSRSARMAGEGVLPGFIHSARGCRITDVDGREYIDFLCGNGPNLLGYRHPEVDAAAAEQAARADLTSFYPELIVAYAERLLAWHPDFHWAVHAKNGSDALTLAARVMRAHTGRPLLVLFERAYHGFAPELTLQPVGLADGALDHTLRLPWNGVDALSSAFAQHGDRIAGVVLNPLDQSPARPTRPAETEFIDMLSTLCRSHHALLTVDDVRHGLRLHAHGSHHVLGIEPDLLCLGKAMANGYATAALLGREPLRAACRQVPFTGSYMFSPVAYQAGLTTLAIYQRDDVLTHLQRMGERLVGGIETAARQHGHDVQLSGPVTMPSLLFGGARPGERARRFAFEAARRGAIFHPSLNWFLCTAHGAADIDEAIAIAAAAFEATPRT